MKNLLIATSLLTLTACVQVPMTTLLIPTPNGLMTVKAPKDSKITGLKANVDKGTISLDSYEARMNPEVISSSAAGQAEFIKALGDFASNMAQLGFRAATASPGGNVVLQPQQPATITSQKLNEIIQLRAEQLAKQMVATNSAEAKP